MEQDFNHWHSEQTLGTQQARRGLGTISGYSRLLHESIVMPFRELLERVFNQGI
jgi:hypothetical protein